jgi:chromosomal replication initiator protein
VGSATELHRSALLDNARHGVHAQGATKHLRQLGRTSLSIHAQPQSAASSVQPDAARLIERLIASIGAHRYEMWFNTARIEANQGNVQVYTTSQFVARWIESNLMRELKLAATDVLGESAEVLVCVEEPAGINQPSVQHGEDASPLRFPNHATQQLRPVRRALALRKLDDFVVGPSNRLAYSAACSISDGHDAATMSPLFIHGECGVGKTHLLQGVCHRAAELYGHRQVRYVTGEQFTNEFITAVRNQSIDEFRDRVRKLAVLAIDDVQFLSNKARTQSEFQHTLDAIEHLGAKLVLASNEHPRQIKKFSPALVSRLMQGMVVQVDPPDRETRIKLIRKIAASRQLRIMDAATELIATRCVGSVRELEGTINKLTALRTLSHAGSGAGNTSAGQGEVGLLLVEQLFNEHGWKTATPVRIGCIIDTVCSRLGLGRGDLMGSGRHRRVVLARAMVAYLGRELTTLSYPEIAQAMGRRHHSTVHSAAQRLSRQIAAGECITLSTSEATILLADLVDQLRHEINRQ